MAPDDAAPRAARAVGVERLSFGADVGFTPADELLDNVTIAPLTGTIFAGAPFQAAVFRIAPGGRIVRHPALVPQLLAVLEEAARSAANGVPEPIGAGDAVFWQEGEEHETTSAGGLTALILEGDRLEPYRRR